VPDDPNAVAPPPPPGLADAQAPIGGAWSPQAPRGLSVAGGPGRGIVLTSGDGFFALNLRGRIQLRDTVVVPQDASASTNDLSLRTLRLIFSGHVFSRQTQYVLQLALAPQDFEANTVSPVFDAWIAFNQLRDLQVRVGQFFVPFDRARTNAEWGLDAVERPGVVQEVSLDRDIGVELSSSSLGGLPWLQYRLGIFGGDGKNRVNTAPGFLYAARVQVSPFGAFDDNVEGDLARLARPRLAIGVGGAYNQNSNRARSTTGAVLALGGFDYWHAAADVVFKYGGFYFLGEALYRQAAADRHDGMQSMTAVTEYSRSAWGYLAQAGMMLTDRLEVVARWEQMFALGATDPALIAQVRATGNDAGVGLNWYQAGHGLKLQADYHYLFGDNLAAGRQQIRLQLQASF
jgi:hypothetical protein